MLRSIETSPIVIAFIHCFLPAKICEIFICESGMMIIGVRCVNLLVLCAPSLKPEAKPGKYTVYEMRGYCCK
jgi:hypothetical protein